MAVQPGSNLDFIVLAIIANGDAYGYSITQRAKKLMTLSESALYPILRRLKKEGMLEVYDSTYQGRNRRYYTITDSGRGMLAQYRDEWNEYKNAIDEILSGGYEE